MDRSLARIGLAVSRTVLSTFKNTVDLQYSIRMQYGARKAVIPSLHSWVVIALTTSVAIGCTAHARDPVGEIVALMDAQVTAWNAGDIEGFLEGYLNSPDLIFASRGTFARGWDSTLRRYKKAYRPEAMGHLTFSDVEVFPIDDDYAWAIGKWALETTNANPHGAFTLVLHRTRAGWRIIHDHSSGVVETEETTRSSEQ